VIIEETSVLVVQVTRMVDWAVLATCWIRTLVDLGDGEELVKSRTVPSFHSLPSLSKVLDFVIVLGFRPVNQSILSIGCLRG